MLEIARAKVPEAEFSLGDLRSLPLRVNSVDLAVCSLALTHLPDLDTPFCQVQARAAKGRTRGGIDHSPPLAAVRWRSRNAHAERALD
jgi:hypothetical protein